MLGLVAQPFVRKANVDKSLLGILTALGLTTNLQVCLDAGDIRCWDGVNDLQLWKDCSGNNYHFFRGASGSAGSDDPTFNGTPGALTNAEYWSFDGGDYFTLNQSNPTWVNDMHKSGAIWSGLCWFYRPSSGFSATNDADFVGTGATSSGQVAGISWNQNASAGPLLEPRLRIGNGSVNALSENTSIAYTVDDWQQAAISIDAAVGAGGLTLSTNKSHGSLNSTLTSPTASNASNTMKLMTTGNGTIFVNNGSRLAMMALWSGTRLTTTNIDNIYDAIVAARSY